MSAAWKVDDFNSDLRRLNCLLSIICEIRFELPVGEDDDRIDNLLWIAREMAEGLMEHDDQEGERYCARLAKEAVNNDC